MRIAELKAARDLISGIVSSGKLESETEDDWSSWQGAVDMRDGEIIAAGHSLGGTAVVSSFHKFLDLANTHDELSIPRY